MADARVVADAVFDRLIKAIDDACAGKDYRVALRAAESEGLRMTDTSRLTVLQIEYRGQLGQSVLELKFRSFNQSQAFSIMRGLNWFSLTLMDAKKRVIRAHTDEFKD
jgi:hypothetical protein